MTIGELTTKEQFSTIVADIQNAPGYRRPAAFGIGIGTTDEEGNFLEVYYPFPNFEGNFGTAAILSDVLQWDGATGFRTVDLESLARILGYFAPFRNDGEKHGNIEALAVMNRALLHSPMEGRRREVVAAFIADPADRPVSVPDAYLRLHLLSHRLVLPNTINVKPGELMPVLPNIAWTSAGPIPAGEANELIADARALGQPLRVYGVDKLPNMLDYVVPSGVRIADTARVRLGAYVGDGTTVMPAGFINFNAGTKGKAMIEGRVSQGVIVGHGSDLGGAASTQGTMSGGSKVLVSIGDRTLVGALAGVGIPLGDDCIVGAGLYIMPKTEVALYDKHGVELKVALASELAGESGIMYKRGHDGRVEAHPNTKDVELNPVLHAKQ